MAEQKELVYNYTPTEQEAAALAAYDEKTRACLLRHLPLRVFVRKNVETERYEGLVEHSFSMGYDVHRVHVIWSGIAYSMLGQHVLDAVENVKDSQKYHPEAEAFDPLSPECPVAVDLVEWVAAFTDKDAHKFDKRNAFFEQRA